MQREKGLGLITRRTQPSLEGQRRPLEGITQGELGRSVGRLVLAEGTASRDQSARGKKQ